MLKKPNCCKICGCCLKHKFLWGILVLALLLRLVGINHGFPFVFHPDEPALVRTALSIRFFPNPKHFDWPHFFIYLNYFLYMLFARVRTFLEIINLKGIWPVLWDDAWIFYLLSRVFAAALGALTVVPIYLTGKTLFGKKTGLFGAAAFAIMPFHVNHAHYALIDVPMVFLLSWCLYFSSKIFLKGRLRDYILAGFFMGLAASTKYHGALGSLVIVLAHFLRRTVHLKAPLREFFRDSQKLAVAAGISVLAFVLGTPYALLDFATFIRTDGPSGALWQFTNVGSVSFGRHVWQLFDAFSSKLPEDLGITFMVLFVLAVAEVVYVLFLYVSSKKKPDELLWRLLFLVVPALFLFSYVSGFVKDRSHYYMIAYPFVAITVGFFVARFLVKRPLRITRILIISGIFLLPFMSAVKVTSAYVRGDTRLPLYEWLRTNVSEKDVLIYDGGDLDLLFGEFSKNTVRKSRNIGVTDLMNFDGYLVASMEEDMSVSVFDGRVNVDILVNEPPVYEIVPKLMRGPWVRVYELPIIK